MFALIISRSGSIRAIILRCVIQGHHGPLVLVFHRKQHTCHISHCEIKSHRIWSIWKAFPIKNIQFSKIFRPFYNRFYEEININSTLLLFSQASYMKKKDFRLYWESSKVMFQKISQNFVKSPLKSCLVSQILVHSLWHV